MADGSFDGADKRQNDDGGIEMLQQTPMHPWHKFKPSLLCSCFNVVLQVVFIGSLGSFMFGINMSLLNTAISSIFSAYQLCGEQEIDPNLWTTPEACLTDQTCVTNCLTTNDDDEPIVRCPGGYNDLDCDSMRWYNAVMSCSVLIGGAVGSATGGRFLQFGRRTVLIVTMIIFCIGSISAATSNSFSALLWARLITGYAVGLSAVTSPTYMSEVTPATKRGSYGVMHQLMIVTGILIAMLIGLPLSDPDAQDDLWVPSTFQQFWWRFMLALGVLPSLLALYLLIAVYSFDTPVWYVEQRRFKDAEALLKILYEKEDVKSELKTIVDNVRQGEIQRQQGMTFGTAFSEPELRFVIIFGCVLSAFQQFGGINVFMTSSSDLFRSAGLSGTMQTVMSVIMGVINFLMTFPTLYLIERMGRKSLLLIGCICQFVMVVPGAISYWTEDDFENPGRVTQILCIVGVLGFVAFFAVSYGPVLWVYLFEIYPMEIKDVAASVAATANWVAGVVMVFLIIVIPNHIGFTIFAIMTLIACLIVFFFMRETKGRELGDSPYVTKRNQV